MPSRYSSPGSLSDAAELALRLACDFRKISIEEPFGAFLQAVYSIERGGARFGANNPILLAVFAA